MTRLVTRVTRHVICYSFCLPLCCLFFVLRLLVYRWHLEIVLNYNTVMIQWTGLASMLPISLLVSSNLSILHYSNDNNNGVRRVVFTIIFQSYRGGNRNTQKTTGLPQVTVKLDRIMLYRVHLELTTLKMIDTNPTISCSCKLTFKQ